jgi:hypothetical protein
MGGARLTGFRLMIAATVFSSSSCAPDPDVLTGTWTSEHDCQYSAGVFSNSNCYKETIDWKFHVTGRTLDGTVETDADIVGPFGVKREGHVYPIIDGTIDYFFGTKITFRVQGADDCGSFSGHYKNNKGTHSFEITASKKGKLITFDDNSGGIMAHTSFWRGCHLTDPADSATLECRAGPCWKR